MVEVTQKPYIRQASDPILNLSSHQFGQVICTSEIKHNL